MKDSETCGSLNDDSKPHRKTYPKVAAVASGHKKTATPMARFWLLVSVEENSKTVSHPEGSDTGFDCSPLPERTSRSSVAAGPDLGELAC
jgi:hypothetical protein